MSICRIYGFRSRSGSAVMITTALPTRGASVSDKFFRSVLPGDEREVPKIDSNVAHIARVYDYWLGGKGNFAGDPEIVAKFLQIPPEKALPVQASRKFLARSVRPMAPTEGVRQFLDIGTGPP